MSRLITRLLLISCRHAWTVVTLALLAGVGAGFYAAGHMAIDTDNSKLFSPTVHWRKIEAVLESAFPHQKSLIAVIVDGTTPELAESATAALAKRLAEQPALFSRVTRPDGGPFFSQNGLL